VPGKKCKPIPEDYMECGNQEEGTINMGQPREKRTEFKYLGTVIDSEGTLTLDKRAKINATWMK